MQRVGDMPHAASSTWLTGRSAAEIAQAEVEAFRQRQADMREEGEADAQGDADALSAGAYMKSSPDVSSPEEEMHIRREGNSVHTLPEGGSTPAGSGPSSRWGVPESAARDKGGGGGNGQHAAASGEGTRSAENSGDSQEESTGGESLSSSGAVSGEGREGAEPERSSMLVAPLKRQASMLNECRSVEHYEKLNRISEGTYGVVYRARDRETGGICALKKVKLEKERDGFPLTSVREINVLLSLAHPNIVNVSEVVVGSSLDAVFMVMEYADHDLKSVMDRRMKQAFSTAEVKCLMAQLLAGVAYLHENWVLHRDLKTSNILYTNTGVLKICDFGLARQYGSPLKPYTHLVVTLWYRAPELLLGEWTRWQDFALPGKIHLHMFFSSWDLVPAHRTCRLSHLLDPGGRVVVWLYHG